MQTTKLGKTGLDVSRLGFGLVEIGRLEGPDGTAEAGRLLNTALDSGINFLDTAACYRNSEDLIGATVAHRRDEYVLATKCGHVVGGAPGEVWSAATVEHNIDRSLGRLRTDRLDLVQVHSCDREVLERGEVIEALEKARDAGKTRFIGFSGDDDAALWAIESGRFDTLQTSLNILDQSSRTTLLEPAESQGMGVIIKRPIGNAVWGTGPEATGGPASYRSRAAAMADAGPVPGAPEDSILLALGFLFAHEQVDTAIVGTRNPGPPPVQHRDGRAPAPRSRPRSSRSCSAASTGLAPNGRASCDRRVGSLWQPQICSIPPPGERSPLARPSWPTTRRSRAPRIPLRGQVPACRAQGQE